MNSSPPVFILNGCTNFIHYTSGHNKHVIAFFKSIGRSMWR